MASGIEALRKSYAQLTPFERANMMLHEATTKQRDAVAEALVAPTLWDAYREAGITCGLVMVAGFALAQSLKAERRRLANLVIAMKKRADGEKIVPGDAYDAALETAAQCREMAEGWLTALAMLEKETGGAFLAAATLLDDTYPHEMLAKAQQRKGGPADDSEQLAMLRHAWQAMGGENS